MKRIAFTAASLALASLPLSAVTAQNIDIADPFSGASSPTRLIPKLTPVEIEILEDLSSDKSKPLATFTFRTATPVLIDGFETIPAGTPGAGEVVHAKKAGLAGSAGELVLAARYLDMNGERVVLRSMRFAQAGADRTKTASAINSASAAAPIPGLGLLGFAIKGGNITVPAGTIATAMTAQDFAVANRLQVGTPIEGTSAAGLSGLPLE